MVFSSISNLFLNDCWNRAVPTSSYHQTPVSVIVVIAVVVVVVVVVVMPALIKGKRRISQAAAAAPTAAATSGLNAGDGPDAGTQPAGGDGTQNDATMASSVLDLLMLLYLRELLDYIPNLCCSFFH